MSFRHQFCHNQWFAIILHITNQKFSNTLTYFTVFVLLTDAMNCFWHQLRTGRNFPKRDMTQNTTQTILLQIAWTMRQLKIVLKPVAKRINKHTRDLPTTHTTTLCNAVTKTVSLNQPKHCWSRWNMSISESMHSSWSRFTLLKYQQQHVPRVLVPPLPIPQCFFLPKDDV